MPLQTTKNYEILVIKIMYKTPICIRSDSRESFPHTIQHYSVAIKKANFTVTPLADIHAHVSWRIDMAVWDGRAVR